MTATAIKTDAPRWASLCDLSIDCTDAYQEQTDPTNELGETCDALFSCEMELDNCNPDPFAVEYFSVAKLLGFVVTDKGGPSYVSTDTMRGMCGPEFIGRIEAAANRQMGA